MSNRSRFSGFAAFIGISFLFCKSAGLSQNLYYRSINVISMNSFSNIHTFDWVHISDGFVMFSCLVIISSTSCNCAFLLAFVGLFVRFSEGKTFPFHSVILKNIPLPSLLWCISPPIWCMLTVAIFLWFSETSHNAGWICSGARNVSNSTQVITVCLGCEVRNVLQLLFRQTQKDRSSTRCH
jgi:hypothetical protein